MTLTVCMVGPLPPPAGGMANQTRDLVASLRGEGIDVTIVTTNAPISPASVARIPVLRAVLRFIPFVAALWRALRSVDVAHVMANSGLSWYLFAAPAIWIARRRSVPVVVNYRGGNARDFFQRSWKRVGPLIQGCHVAVPSEFLKGVFRDFGVDAQIVPNFVSIEPRVSASPSPADAPHLLVTRHLEAIYDVGTCIRAFALLRPRFPNARLTIAGDGSARPALESLCRELDIGRHVRFAGNVRNDALKALLASADVLLNSSLVDNTPVSLIEALACGVPIVSTSAGGIPFLVKDGHTALLVAPGDADALAAAADRLLSSPALTAILVENGLRSAEQFRWSSVRSRWLSLYLDAVPPAAAVSADRVSS